MDGGAWGYWFCEGCNGSTGRWDEIYTMWHHDIVLAIHPEGAPARKLPPSLMGTGDPGGFVRSIWAWAFALDMTESLHHRYPDLADAIQAGTPTVPPIDLRLLLAATTSLEFTIKAGEPNALMMVVCAPPFIVAASHEQPLEGVPLVDVSRWIEDPAGVKREVPLLLPTVNVSDMNVRDMKVKRPPIWSDFEGL